MIVTCESCEASFKVDDSRIPPKGINVRCSKCKHVFVVRQEAAGDFLSEFDDFERSLKDRTEEATADTTGDKLARVSEEPAGISFEDFMSKEEPALEAGEAGLPGEEAISREFERPEEPPREEAPSGEDTVAPVADEKAAQVSEEPAGISFEDFMGKEEPAPEPSGAEPPGEKPVSEEFEQPEAPLQVEEPSEELDLQPPSAPEAPEVSAAAPEETSTEEEPELSVETFFKEQMAQESEDQARQASVRSVKGKKFEDLLREKGLGKGLVRRRSSFRTVLLLILLLLLGGGAYLWWQNQGTSVSLPTGIGSTLETAVEKVSGLWDDIIGSQGGGLELSGLQGYEEKIGQHRIYVIKGEVTNTSRRVRKYVKLRVIILDQAGNRIREKVIFCGNVFTREELEKLSPRFLTGEENLQPKRPKDMVVEPNQTISFMAIFSGLPREGKSFKVEKLEAPGV